MVSQLNNELCCIKHFWGTYEHNNTCEKCSCRWLDSWVSDHCQLRLIWNGAFYMLSGDTVLFTVNNLWRVSTLWKKHCYFTYNWNFLRNGAEWMNVFLVKPLFAILFTWVKCSRKWMVFNTDIIIHSSTLAYHWEARVVDQYNELTVTQYFLTLRKWPYIF